MHYTIKTSDTGEPDTFFAFQLLALETRPIVVDTGVDTSQAQGLFGVTIQPVEVWSYVLRDRPKELNVYVLSEPCVSDVLHINGDWCTDRDRWQAWQSCPSDVDGCALLCDPQLLCPRVSLLHAACPVLSLMDKLHEGGFEPKAGLVHHNASSAALYDDRNILGSRRYLQCLVCMQELINSGVTGLRSGQSQAYYALLLKTKKDVEPHLSARDLRRRLAALDDDQVALFALGRPASSVGRVVAAAPLAKKPRSAPPAEDGSVAGDESPSAGQSSSSASSSSSSSSEEATGSVAVGDEKLDEVTKLPEELCGQKLRFISGRSDGRWTYRDRLSVKCPNEAHVGCSKSRSTTMLVNELGPTAPLLFLAAWLRKAHLPQAEHRRFEPSRAEMRAEAPSLA